MTAGQPRPGPVWPCRHRPGEGTGSYEESARRASHEELAVARLLVGEGHHVRTVPEGRGGRSPDLLACGVSVEVKSFQALAARDGRPPGPQAVANKLLDARGQGAVAILWAGRSGLTEAVARDGFARFCQEAAVKGLGRSRAVRIVGDGFDLSLSPLLELASGLGRGSPVPRAGPRATPRARGVSL